jgi:acyl-CoA thioesterase FadM
MWEADQRGWKAETGAPVPFITAGLEVKFLRPTPLGPALSLHAEPETISESEIVVNAELVFDEKQRATLRAQWLRFHPR